MKKTEQVRAQAAITAIESREKIHVVHGEPKRGRGMHKKRQDWQKAPTPSVQARIVEQKFSRSLNNRASVAGWQYEVPQRTMLNNRFPIS